MYVFLKLIWVVLIFMFNGDYIVAIKLLEIGVVIDEVIRDLLN